MRILWLAFGASHVLLALPDFRINQSFLGSDVTLYVPAPILILMLISAVGLVGSAAGPGRRKSDADRGSRIPGALLFVIVVYMYLSVFFATNMMMGIREVAKFAVDILTLFAVVRFFPNDLKLLGQVWELAIWGSAALFAVLIYQYAFVFHSPFLGLYLDSPSRQYRNMLMWYTIFVLPFAMTNASFRGGVRGIRMIPLLVLIVAVLYGASRTTWIAVAAGTLCVVPFVLGPRRQGQTSKLLLLGIIGLLGWSAWTTVAGQVGQTVDAGRRFQYLYDPASVPELNSFENRAERVQDAFDGFKASPIFGIGFTNTGLSTHNDYAAVLAELGVIGAILFGILIYRVFRTLWPMSRDLPQEFLWLSIATRIVLVGMFISLLGINGYNSPLVWLFLGLAYKLHHLERGVRGVPFTAARPPRMRYVPRWRTP